jgi:DNA-directed RNA polymerase subunit RPC12/RpoP
MALIVCKECGKQISDTAKACPHCGAQVNTKPKAKSGCFTKFFKLILYLILAILAFAFIGYLFGPKDNTSNSSPKPTNSEMKENTTEKKADFWSGEYIGQEKCSMGRNKNEWSNQYQITITQLGDEYELSGIYFQANQTIRCRLNGDVLIIPEQTIGDSSFIIRGQGTRNGNKLRINYEVDVIVNFEPKQYETNSCSAEYELQ